MALVNGILHPVFIKDVKVRKQGERIGKDKNRGLLETRIIFSNRMKLLRQNKVVESWVPYGTQPLGSTTLLERYRALLWPFLRKAGSLLSSLYFTPAVF